MGGWIEAGRLEPPGGLHSGQLAGMYQVPFWSIQYSEVVIEPSGHVWVTVQC